MLLSCDILAKLLSHLKKWKRSICISLECYFISRVYVENTITDITALQEDTLTSSVLQASGGHSFCSSTAAAGPATDGDGGSQSSRPLLSPQNTPQLWIWISQTSLSTGGILIPLIKQYQKCSSKFKITTMVKLISSEIVIVREFKRVMTRKRQPTNVFRYVELWTPYLFPTCWSIIFCHGNSSRHG